MKKVILTVGPQGAGKSTFCEVFVKLHPVVKLASRDKILHELFGSAWLDPYCGAHHYDMEAVWEVVVTHLFTPDIVTIILDCWNGFPAERRNLTAKLRRLKADKIEAWYFTTSENTCVAWYLKKPGQQKLNELGPEFIDFQREMRANSIRSDYKLYHQQSLTLAQGFDKITKINPEKITPADICF